MRPDFSERGCSRTNSSATASFSISVIVVEALKKQGLTILLTTHHLDEAEHLCSRVGIMKDGRIAKEGTIPQLLSLVPAKAIALVEASEPRRVLTRAAALGWSVRHYAGRIGCLLPQQVSLEEVVRALSGIDASSVSLQRVSLEHAYLEVVHERTEQLQGNSQITHPHLAATAS